MPYVVVKRSTCTRASTESFKNVAELDNPEKKAYYCAPQGHVTARGTVKRRDLDQLHDPDYHPSPAPQTSDEEQEVLAELEGALEDRAVVGSDEDEQEDQAEEDEQEERAGQGTIGGLATVEGYKEAARPNMDDVASEASAFERSFATSSSTQVLYKVSRLPDFRLSHAWLDSNNGEELVRYNAAVVEVKLCTEKTIMSSKISHQRVINRVMNDMAPQVIEAVQVAFAERPDQKEIVAIPTVNSFCCFVYFSRGMVPPLDPAMANQGKGFQDPTGRTGRRLYDKYGKRYTQTIQIMYGGGDFFDKTDVKTNRQASGAGERKILKFGDTFVVHWNNFIRWTRGRDLFPDPEDDEDEEDDEEDSE